MSVKRGSKRISTAVVVLPVILVIVWNVLDANPTLWLYDKLQNGGSNHAIVHERFPSLHSSTVWITGASSGIGAQLVCQLFAAHTRHVILSSRSMDKMHQVVKTCQGQYPDSPTTTSVVYYNALDDNNKQSTKTVQNALVASPDKSIDIMILCSGIYHIEPALNTSMDEVRRIFRVNYESPIELFNELIRQDQWKTRSTGGQVVVVASVMAKGPSSLTSHYAASKAALKNYFQSLSTEEWAWLRVNTILPGATRTDFWQHAGTDVRPDPGTLMEPQRVAHLILTAMNGPYVLTYEVWICKSSALLYIFMSHYTPALFYFTNHIVALVRQKALITLCMDRLELVSIVREIFLLPFRI